MASAPGPGPTPPILPPPPDPSPPAPPPVPVDSPHAAPPSPASADPPPPIFFPPAPSLPSPPFSGAAPPTPPSTSKSSISITLIASAPPLDPSPPPPPPVPPVPLHLRLILLLSTSSTSSMASAPGPGPTTPAIAPSPPPPSDPSPPSPPPASAHPPPAIFSPPAPSLPSPPFSGVAPPTPPSTSKSSISITLIAGVAGGAVAVLLLLALLCMCLRRKRKQSHDPPLPHHDHYDARPPAPPLSPLHVPFASLRSLLSQHQSCFLTSSSGEYASTEQPPRSPPVVAVGLYTSSAFSYEELKMATDGFSDANLLGQGGFGYVHRGVLRGGKEVAVKQLKSGSGQGDREFQTEVEIISRVHHRHLVSLVGYCITEGRRILVYEFVPNNTLEFHLHGKGRPTMEWSTRLNIALGAARGLAYLHEDCHPKVIHRDIKAANILIDFKYDAKVADFGLAKFSADNDTHVSTRVMGTFGYLAPEYAASGKLTEKSDVFSFGVMLHELVTGRRPFATTGAYMEDSLVDWARPLVIQALEDGNYDSLADPRLQQNYNAPEMARMVACAAACVRHSARRRPRMGQIVRVLEGGVSLEDLNDGVTPGQSSGYGSNANSDYSSGQYNEGTKKLRKLAFASEVNSSTDYSTTTTSEYGRNTPGLGGEGPRTREMEMGRSTHGR